jgi:molybdate transport system ATP-binding protein
MSRGLSLKIAHGDATGFRLNVDTSLPPQGITALFGPSGSGKTTLLDCIAGLRRDVRDAQIRFGDDLWQHGQDRRPPWARPVAYVFQDARLFPHLSVRGNLDYARHRAGPDAPPLDEVASALDINALLDRQPQTLSAGQGQRVAIARALLSGPQLLLLDEPTANLDREAAAHCLRCLASAASNRKLPMLYVSHRIEEVASIADHLLLLREGKIEADGPLPQLLAQLDTQLAEEDSAAAILLARVGEEDEDGLTALTADGEALYVSARAPAGSLRRLRVPARDVSVCRVRPQQTSILNVLPVVLEEMRPAGDAHSLLRLRLREQHLLARITRRSSRELDLRPGDQLFAQIKSSALLDGEGTV